MLTWGQILLMWGLVFPAISYLSYLACVWAWARTGRHSSSVMIPFIGPVLLTVWVWVEHYPWWMIVVVWGLDIGTLWFLFVLPSMLREWRTYSRFTLILSLRGTSGIRTVYVSFHAGGHYLMIQSWARPQGECGIVQLGEPGTYVSNSEGFELRAHFGLSRHLVRKADGSYLIQEVNEADQPEATERSVDGWILKPQSPASSEEAVVEQKDKGETRL